MKSSLNLTVARKTFWAALISFDLATCRRILRMVLA
jgi:hypothetical protein